METAEQFAAAIVIECKSVGNTFKPILEGAVSIIRDRVSENFDASQAPNGSPWPERKDNLPHPLLIKSGTLETAATRNGANHIERVNDDSLQYGVTGLPYAARQNFGDKPGSRDSLGRRMNIPARTYMAIGTGDVDKIADMAAGKMADLFLGKG